MIDPLTALGIATTAFKTVQKLIATGKELGDVTSHLGKFFTAVADIRQAEDVNKNPPLFKKLVYKKSIEEEALNILLAKKAADEHEAKLREMIIYRFGMETLREMYQMRRTIKEARDRTVYRREQLKQTIQDSIIIFFTVLTGVGAIWLLVNLVVNKGGIE